MAFATFQLLFQFEYVASRVSAPLTINSKRVMLQCLECEPYEMEYECGGGVPTATSRLHTIKRKFRKSENLIIHINPMSGVVCGMPRKFSL